MKRRQGGSPGCALEQLAERSGGERIQSLLSGQRVRHPPGNGTHSMFTRYHMEKPRKESTQAEGQDRLRPLIGWPLSLRENCDCSALSLA